MKKRLPGRFAIIFCFAAMAGSLLGGCRKTNPGKPKSIYETISQNENYSFLSAAVTKAGLQDALEEKGKTGLTLFAPDNNAFIAAGIKGASDLNAIPNETLKAILLYHVLGSVVKASDIPQAANTGVVTLNGKQVYATRTAANKVFINGVRVVKADIACTNGVIHDIDRVLMPAVGTIVETAQGNADLSLLVAAVLRASQGSTNVAGVLSGTGPFTVFAPTNQAFINAGFANAQAINAADPNTLTAILTYHVLSGRIFSSDLQQGLMPVTVNGEKVTISLQHGPQVKGKSNTTASNIVATDIVATNGVVHVIDQVLLP